MYVIGICSSAVHIVEIPQETSSVHVEFTPLFLSHYHGSANGTYVLSYNTGLTGVAYDVFMVYPQCFVFQSN